MSSDLRHLAATTAKNQGGNGASGAPVASLTHSYRLPTRMMHAVPSSVVAMEMGSKPTSSFDHQASTTHSTTTTQYSQKQPSPHQLPRHQLSPPTPIYPTSSSNSKNNLTSPSPSQGTGLAFFGTSGSGGVSGGSGSRGGDQNSATKVRTMMERAMMVYSHLDTPEPLLSHTLTAHSLHSHTTSS